MNHAEIKRTLEKIAIDIDAIVDERVASTQRTLLHLVEMLAGENASLKETIQKLHDEINRLKGERGKPNFNEKKKPEKFDPNHSSE